jgi:prepilin-type N-terminal cleavage/methylation domain-containing protein
MRPALSQSAGTPARARSAFTLTELLVAITIFTMIIGGVVYAHITGLKMFEWVRIKIGASDDARKTMSLLVAEVRSSQDWEVGEGTASAFTPVMEGTDFEGNAVKVYRADWHATQNSNSFIIYYRDPATSNLLRREGGAGSPAVVAESLTNNVVFSATDYRGVVLTEKDANPVLAVSMEFYQIRYPIVAVGSNQHFEYYQMTTRVSKRSL